MSLHWTHRNRRHSSRWRFRSSKWARFPDCHVKAASEAYLDSECPPKPCTDQPHTDLSLASAAFCQPRYHALLTHSSISIAQYTHILCKWQVTGKLKLVHLPNDLECIKWHVKPYSRSYSVAQRLIPQRTPKWRQQTENWATKIWIQQ